MLQMEDGNYNCEHQKGKVIMLTDYIIGNGSTEDKQGTWYHDPLTHWSQGDVVLISNV